jgi:hypothetical protein
MYHNVNAKSEIMSWRRSVGNTNVAAIAASEIMDTFAFDDVLLFKAFKALRIHAIE